MNDLEICKRIAEIEGELPILEESIKARNKILAQVQRKITITDIYNPLTDDALCFKLMIKYRVMLDYDNDLFIAQTLKGLFSSGWEPTENLTRLESPNKAICLAIIEAHNK
jgi:hypothetical protein